MVLICSRMLEILIPVLVNVAFVTLLERKILGLAQLRRGPNKVSFMGFLQPISDAIKLFTKQLLCPRQANLVLFMSAPAAALMLMLILWPVLPLKFDASPKMTSLYVLAFLSLGVYPLFLAGWASNSKYAHLGGVRGIAQTVSYEISLAFVLFSLLSLSHSLNMFNLNASLYQMFLLSTPLLGLWFISCVAETNRTPFDFSEGESELVSGFNVEYGGVLFAMIFMAEYGMILFLSGLSSSLFALSALTSICWLSLSMLLTSLWIVFRATYPRYRYDKLLNLAWKSFLPMALAAGVFFPAAAMI